VVNFGPVTPEFNRLTNVDQQFSYVRLVAPLLDAAVISAEVCEAISTQFCFSYSPWGVTAMPRGLHAMMLGSATLFELTNEVDTQAGMPFGLKNISRTTAGSTGRPTG